MKDWKEAIKLREGESFHEETHKMKGTLMQTDVYEFSIIDVSGNKIGDIRVVDHTDISPPFKQSIHVKQTYDIEGVVVDEYLN